MQLDVGLGILAAVEAVGVKGNRTNLLQGHATHASGLLIGSVDNVLGWRTVGTRSEGQAVLGSRNDLNIVHLPEVVVSVKAKANLDAVLVAHVLANAHGNSRVARSSRVYCNARVERYVTGPGNSTVGREIKVGSRNRLDTPCAGKATVVLGKQKIDRRMTHEVDYSRLQIGHVRSTSDRTSTAKVTGDACVV